MSRIESALPPLIQASLPAPERVPPVPPEGPSKVPPEVPLEAPPEAPPQPLEMPPQSPPEIREPDLPGEHLPVSDGPRPAAVTLHAGAGDVRGGDAAC